MIGSHYELSYRLRQERSGGGRKTGFTLVELSIVLVIVGLLVAGIVGGVDMVRAAKNRKIISERDQILTSINTFVAKYNCLPGDCYDIATYLSGVTNGDGDEILDGAAVVGGYGEFYGAWQHLSSAGLYPGSYSGTSGPSSGQQSIIGTNVPASKAISNSGYTFYYKGTVTGEPDFWNGKHNNILFFGKENSANVTLNAVVKPIDAYNIDKKIDDGIPGTGKILTYPSIGYCETTGNSLSAPASSSYYITYDAIACRFIYLIEW